MDVDVDSLTQTEEKLDTTISLVTPGSDSLEVDQFNQIISENLPLPLVLGAQTYQTESIDINRIEGIDSNEVSKALVNTHIYRSRGVTIVTEEYLRYTKGVKFDGDMIFVRKNDLSYGILKPDLSHINSTEEEARYLQYEKGPDAKRKKIYRYADGTPILQENGFEIPIYRSKKLEYALRLSEERGEISKMQNYFQRYLDNPERISYDGHSIQKHSFDSILALKLLIEDKFSTSSFYKIELGQKKHQEGMKSSKYDFVLSTNEVITLPGQYEPEKLVHTEIAREMANALKERMNTQSTKEQNRIGRNLRIWIGEFAKDEPILGIVLYNEIKYLLKYDYNLEYEVKKEYTAEDIDRIFPEDGIKEIVGERNIHNDISRKISDIFKYPQVRNGSSLEEVFSFESKVDNVLEYLKTINIDSNTLDYLRLSAGFDRTVKPKVVLSGIRTNDGILPTTSITTSYLKEFLSNTFIGDFGKYSVSKSMQETILKSAREGRDILDNLYMSVGESVSEIKNIHLLEGRWVDRIGEQLPNSLNMNRDMIERFALVAKS
ncbi:MAG: hypothetical protein ACOX0X_03245 [Candidatus Dojkabacteria bacterium]